MFQPLHIAIYVLVGFIVSDFITKLYISLMIPLHAISFQERSALTREPETQHSQAYKDKLIHTRSLFASGVPGFWLFIILMKSRAMS